MKGLLKYPIDCMKWNPTLPKANGVRNIFYKKCTLLSKILIYIIQYLANLPIQNLLKR